MIPMLRSACLLFLFSAPWPNSPMGMVTATGVPCTSTEECDANIQKGSICVDGLCTNPFYNGGCLKSMHPNWNKTRICSSHDPPEAEELGFCRPSPLGYMEVRMGSGSWESSVINNYLLQILLTELLEVPASVEYGIPDVDVNLYQKDSNFDFWLADGTYHKEELGVATRVKDCRTVTSDPANYEACFHFDPENWWNAIADKSAIPELESVKDLGVLSDLAIFVPKFVVDEDPTVMSYVGLSGESNRRKLAEMFKSPTRWEQYCTEVSPTNCTTPDPIAQRAPQDESEKKKFFVEGVFNGHFRKTEDHNCDAHPDSCAGDFINAMCSWSSFANQQFYHNNIALAMRGPDANGGYGYSEQYQIYAAANATKSAVMILAYSTDPPYQQYMRTEAEMTRVMFAPPTQECFDARVNPSLTCNPNVTLFELYGSAEGACDTYPEPLKKLFSNGFREISLGDDIPEEFKSPAYHAVELYQVTELSYQQIYQGWQQRGPSGYDLREATCQWVIDNLDLFQSFIPKSHPRMIVEVDETKTDGLVDTGLGLALIATLLCILSLGLVFLRQRTKVIYYLQKGFLNLLLVGLTLISLGAVFLSAHTSDWTCALASWALNMGYLALLVPMFVRISAISELATSGKQMQRVKIDLRKLYIKVAAATSIVASFVLAWTILDAPTRTLEYEMTEELGSEGETVIMAYAFCGSDHDFWMYIVFAWRAALLVPSCTTAMLASRVKEDINDTRAMTMVLCTLVFFLLLQTVMFLVLQGDAESDLMAYSSIIYSADALVSLAVYVLPKFLASGEELEDEPLPDVFVHTTIAMLDVQGFTAWSSVREPVQVFQFLEQLYEHFDKLAERHGVYKVETVGECYVAATGIPSTQSDHCVRMVSFAIDAMKKMPKVVKKMEVQFGPDTSDLTLQIGITSGPVTGGFLKGKGARFQVFGDTCTTAKLIQKHGMNRRIHLSQAAAELLIKANKKSWVMEREDSVKTVEKGEMKTYWLVKGFRHEYDIDDKQSCAGSLAGSEEDEGVADLQSKQRWIEFNVETFKGLLKQIVARREAGLQVGSAQFSRQGESEPLDADMPLEEVVEVIELPGFDKRAAKRQLETNKVEIPDVVVGQLRKYVSLIADSYNENPFHNFAHASYVVMAVTKYMNRIIAAHEMAFDKGEDRNRSTIQAAIHSHTYGITSDPLTQFACVFSALIHDADHPGVPNPQLIKEDHQVAERYKGRSVAEQKSFDIAWDLLMEDCFAELQSTICPTPQSLRRFRQLVVNSVMATDLGDKQLKELRNGRWETAFSIDEASDSISSSDVESGQEVKQKQINRKATIVIEHLIQAADVAHMSQHWNIYRKWNECLFRETYKAWREGRAASNPADGWYKGEIGFFDFYIIPLSKKLRDCGVFGPTSDENLNYATNNRNMWVQEGEEIVKEMLKRAEVEYTQPEMHPGDEEEEIDPSTGALSV